jgi:hypothetical protein
MLPADGDLRGAPPTQEQSAATQVLQSVGTMVTVHSMCSRRFRCNASIECTVILSLQSGGIIVRVRHIFLFDIRVALRNRGDKHLGW